MEQNNIFELFFSSQNPTVFILIVFFILVIVFLLLYKDFIIPLKSKNQKLENERLKLMSQFAEFDPDPVLRINGSGIITNMNNPAQEIFTEKAISQHITNFITTYEELDKNSFNHNQIVLMDGKYFNISIKESELLGFSQIYLHDISQRIKQENQLRKYQANLKMLRNKLDDKNDMEREKIGSDLHDHIGNKISIIKFNLQNYFEEPSKKSAMELLKRIDFVAKEVREISHSLSPKMIKEFGLLPALTQLVDEITRYSKIRGYIKSVNFNEFDDFKLKLGIYRICQEALNNIIKHSNCKEFKIQIVIEDNYLKIFVSDDGIGCAIEEVKEREKPTLGLLNMRERAESLGGYFEFNSIPGEGTTIYFEFNLEKRNHD